MITDAVVGGHGMRNNQGFVLVEVLMDGLAVSTLLVVVALMGVQSLITFPRWSESRDQAHLSILRFDLENLYAQQALHLADRGAYATSLEELGFTPSEGVRVSLAASPGGWSATAEHRRLDEGQECAVFAGVPLGPTTPLTPERRGHVACTAGVSPGDAASR